MKLKNILSYLRKSNKKNSKSSDTLAFPLFKNKPKRTSSNESSCSEYHSDERTLRMVRQMYVDNIANNNTIISKNISISLNKEKTKLNNNVLIIGDDISDINKSIMKTNILNMPVDYDLVIVDYGDDLYSKTVETLRLNGYKIKTLNFNNFKYSNYYNPLKYVKTSEDIDNLVTCILQNTTELADSTNEIIDNINHSILTAYIKLATINENANLFTVIDLINEPVRLDFSTDCIINCINKLECIDDESINLLKHVFASCDQHNLDLKHIYQELIKRFDILYKFKQDLYQDMLIQDNISLESLLDTNTVIYIILPTNNMEYDMIANVALMQIHSLLANTLNKARVFISEYSKRIKCPYLSADIDNISYILSVNNNLDQCDIDCFNHTLNQCDIFAYFGSRYDENNKFVIQLLDSDHKRNFEPELVKEFKRKFPGDYVDYEYRPVVTEDQLRRMHIDSCLIKIKNCDYILCDTKYYSNKPDFLPVQYCKRSDFELIKDDTKCTCTQISSIQSVDKSASVVKELVKPKYTIEISKAKRDNTKSVSLTFETETLDKLTDLLNYEDKKYTTIERSKILDKILSSRLDELLEAKKDNNFEIKYR